MILRSFSILLIVLLCVGVRAQGILEDTEIDVALPKVKKESGFKKLVNLFTDKDSSYCVKSPFKGGIELQDKIQQEYIHFSNSDGNEIKSSSGVSNRVGPYFGYQGLYAGTTFDVFSDKHKRRTEIALYLNTQLCSTEFLWRRTGGDFSVDQFKMRFGERVEDISSDVKGSHIGDYFRNNLTGVNLSFFLNPRKYSNPAGFSRGTIQKRSAGSPVVGLGYSHQKISLNYYDDSDVTDVIKEAREIMDYDGPDVATQMIMAMLQSDDPDIVQGTSLYFARFPSEMKVDEYHLQMGYAYNWVIAPRLLFAIQATVDPGIKHLSVYSRGTIVNDICVREGTLEEMGAELKPFLDRDKMKYDPNNIIGSVFGPNSERQTAFDINYNLKASLTYRWKRWRVSTRFLYSSYNYKKHSTTLRDTFWTLRFYAGYNF